MLSAERRTAILEKLAAKVPGTDKNRWGQLGKGRKTTTTSLRETAMKGKVPKSRVATPGAAKGHSALTPGLKIPK